MVEVPLAAGALRRPFRRRVKKCLPRIAVQASSGTLECPCLVTCCGCDSSSHARLTGPGPWQWVLSEDLQAVSQARQAADEAERHLFWTQRWPHPELLARMCAWMELTLYERWAPAACWSFSHVSHCVPVQIYGEDSFAGLGFLEALKERLQVNIIKEDEDSIEFDLVGVEAPLANALRRILLAEVSRQSPLHSWGSSVHYRLCASCSQVPSVAIESVFVHDNTSIIQDEVLSHRLGLVPLNIDPRLLEFPSPTPGNTTTANTVVFTMDVTGEKPTAPTDGSEPHRFHHVYSSSIQYHPQATGPEWPTTPGPVHPDILLAKLQPGQRICLELHACKGVGKDHAKFSPVATASYRLLPAVRLLRPVYDDDATELAARSKVFDAVPCTDGSGHRLQAVVARPRLCNMSRELLRDAKFSDAVHISRVNDHFIFSVETTGALPARVIVQEAFKVLAAKCEAASTALQAWVSGEAAAPASTDEPAAEASDVEA